MLGRSAEIMASSRSPGRKIEPMTSTGVQRSLQDHKRREAIFLDQILANTLCT